MKSLYEQRKEKYCSKSPTGERHVGKRRAQYWQTLVPLSELRLDPMNPRLYGYGLGPNASNAQVLAALHDMEKQNVNGLRAQLKEAGVINEPLDVTLMPEGDLLVLEGNTRTAAALLMQREQYPDFNYNAIPVRIYDRLDPIERCHLIGAAHVQGKHAHTPAAQAALLDRMQQLGASASDLERWFSTGGSTREIKLKIAAFPYFKAYRAEYPQTPVERFSLFIELAAAGKMFTEFKKNPTFQASMLRWLSEARIRDAHDMRIVAKAYERGGDVWSVFVTSNAGMAIKATQTALAGPVLPSVEAAWESLSRNFGEVLKVLDGDVSGEKAEKYIEIVFGIQGLAQRASRALDEQQRKVARNKRALSAAA